VKWGFAAVILSAGGWYVGLSVGAMLEATEIADAMAEGIAAANLGPWMERAATWAAAGVANALDFMNSNKNAYMLVGAIASMVSTASLVSSVVRDVGASIETGILDAICNGPTYGGGPNGGPPRPLGGWPSL
jgi:hypothetical protein